jgi:hypothetical protein
MASAVRRRKTMNDLFQDIHAVIFDMGRVLVDIDNRLLGSSGTGAQNHVGSGDGQIQYRPDGCRGISSANVRNLSVGFGL